AWVHPAVAFDFMDWCLAQQSQYVIKEAALLYESGSYKDLDEIIMVTAPEKLRIQRVIGRDGMTEKQVLMRIRNQMDEKLKIEKADYIIRNDGDAFLVRQILKLHNHFLNQSF
nr:dephospho-CoA kinase [Saprospiraceae bacterium]